MQPSQQTKIHQLASCNADRCTSDVDTVLAFIILDHACNGSNAQLIAANTGLLIMLIYCWNNLMGEITIKAEATKNHKAIVPDMGNNEEFFGDIDFGSCFWWKRHNLCSIWTKQIINIETLGEIQICKNEI